MYLDVSKLKHSKEMSNPVQTMTYLQVDFTEKCLNKCINCCGFPNQGHPDWPFEKACEVIDVALGDMALKTAFLDCEKEFTMYDYAVDIIDYIEDNYSNVLLLADTNSTVIPENFIERLNTLRSNQFYLSTSLWAWDKESYEQYQGSFLFDTVMKNIKTYLTQLNNKNVMYALSIVYWNDVQFNNTYNLVRKIVEDCGKEVVLTDNGAFNSNVLNSSGSKVQVVAKKSYSAEPRPDDFKDDTDGPILWDRFQNHNAQIIVKNRNGICRPESNVKNNCILLGKNLLVKSTGDIIPCMGTMAIDSYEEASIGNIFEQKVTYEWIKSLFNCDKYKGIKWRNVHDFAFDQCGRCVSALTF